MFATFPIPMRRAAQAALFVCCVSICAQIPAHAAISIAVTPPVIEKVTRPGSTIRDVILFRNAGTEPLDVSVTFVDFTVNEDGSVAERPPGLDPSSILPYAQVTPLRARVEPNQQVNFRYTVRTSIERTIFSGASLDRAQRTSLTSSCAGRAALLSR